MSNTGAKILLRLGLIVAGLAVGLAIGYGYGFTRGSTSPVAADADTHAGHVPHENHAGHDHAGHNHAAHGHAHDTDTHAGHSHQDDAHGHPHATGDHGESDHEDEVLVLSAEAVGNLELVTGPAKISDHFRELLIPGRVVETPGKSDVSVAAPTGGVISKVMVTPGQSIQPDTELFALRVTDEELTSAQLKLLEIVARQKVVRRELKRLEPLSESGIVTGKRSRELAYECDQLAADKNNRVQELTMRGMSESDIENIVSDAAMLQTVTITAKDLFNGDEPASPSDSPLTLESLNVSAGDSVKRGDLLCRMADHQALQIEGQAFETDLESLLTMKQNGWTITAEFGHKQHGDHSHKHAESDLKISHISGRVDPSTQTFLFYIPITNSVVDETTNENGKRYQAWRFVPGQQVHLRVPVEMWDKQFKVPLDAVVQDGAEWFVYRQHLHGAPKSGEPIEVEPVPVRVLYRDDRFAILSPHDQLRPNELIAQNNAYQLHQAFKMKSSGGGGHSHHGHEH